MKRDLQTLGVGIWACTGVLLAGGGGCAQKGSDVRGSASAETRDAAPATASADSGLEVEWFGSTIDQRSLATELAVYADQPVPMSREAEELWNDHGMRLISVPLDDVPRLARALQATGSGGGMSQRQWLGQAYRWTEVARGPEISRRQTVALDAERIELGAGALRLLVRSWLEPAPPAPVVGVVKGADDSGSKTAAVLRVEIVPQHFESGGKSDVDMAFRLEAPKIEAESQGLLFTRLYTKLAMPTGRALVIVSERPGVVWRDLAARVREEDEARQKDEIAQKDARIAERGTDNPWPEPKERQRRAASTQDEWKGVRVKEDEAAGPSAEPAEPDQPAATGAPGVGHVVRGPRPRTAPVREQVEVAGPSVSMVSGPEAPRVPTLGEAMLTRTGRVIDEQRREPAMRSVIILVPRVPSEFRLIGN